MALKQLVHSAAKLNLNGTGFSAYAAKTWIFSSPSLLK